MKRKFIIITISYIIGLIWGLYFNKNITLIFISVLVFVLIKNKFYKVLILITIISSIYSNHTKNNFQNKYINLSEITVVGRIYDKLENEEHYEKFIIEIELLNNKNNYKKDRLLVYVKKNNEMNLEYGDKILIKGTFSEASESRNYGGYNYREYLKTEKIYGIVEIEEFNIKIIQKNDISFYKYIINQSKEIIKNQFHTFLSEEYSEICIALILGDKQNVEEEIINNFSNSNLAHVLAISGMHLTYIILIISRVTKYFGKSKQYIILIITIIFFCNLVGNTSSIVRATIMMILYFISKKTHRKSDSITNLSIAVLLILIENPYAIKSLSFLLSVGGTLGIILFYSYINNFLDNIKLNSQNKIIKYFKSQIALSVAANIIIIPIIARIYNKISIIFLFSNPLASILLSIIMPLIFIFVFTSFLCAPITKFISIILTFFIKCLLFICEISSKFNIFDLIVITPKIWTIVVYYLIVVLFFIKCKVSFFDKKIIMKIIKNIVVIYFLIAVIFYVINMIEPHMHIFFIDVGQGDSTFIITRSNKTILIDGGGSEGSEDYVGKNTLMPYLLDRGVKSLDYIMISHFDSDHCKGILYIMENLDVNNIIIAPQTEITENYKIFLEIVKRKNINVMLVQSGNNVKIDKYTYFEILWPGNRFIEENAINNNSIVARLIYGEFTMLFTGDIEETVEREITKKYNMNSNILKVAHHGSKSSSSEDFIKNVNPEVALIGVGKDNKYGHPSDKTLDTLKLINTEIYRTDLCGEIYIKVSKNGMYKVNQNLKIE